MEKLQKRITGKSSETYVWQDREKTRSSAPRRQRVSRIFGKKFVFGNDPASRLGPWITMFIAVLMIGMIIGKISFVMESRRMVVNDGTINNSILDNIECLTEEYNLDSRQHVFRQKGMQRLGMVEPDEEHVMFFKTVTQNTPDATLAAEGSYSVR